MSSPLKGKATNLLMLSTEQMGSASYPQNTGVVLDGRSSIYGRGEGESSFAVISDEYDK